MPDISLATFQAAHQRILTQVEPSPLRYSHWLSDILDADIYLKLECLQPGRSFKIRGATNMLLSQPQLPDKVVTASGGNHGLGVALAAKHAGIPCHVVLPTYTSSYRVELLQSFGASVELYGAAWDEANTYAQQEATQEGVLYIHPFADLEVMTGQGTIALEVASQLDHFDLFMASIGGGGLLGGNLLALQALGMDHVTTIGVETAGADSMAQSLQTGYPITLDAITSIAKTLGAKQTTDEIFQIHKQFLDACLVIPDHQAVTALFQFLDHEKLLVEPATSCIVAAMLQNKGLFAGKSCVIVICGSNVTYQEALGWQAQFDIDLP